MLWLALLYSFYILPNWESNLKNTKKKNWIKTGNVVIEIYNFFNEDNMWFVMCLKCYKVNFGLKGFFDGFKHL